MNNKIATSHYMAHELELVAERAKTLILRGTPVAVNYDTAGNWTVSYPIAADLPTWPSPTPRQG